MHNHSGTPQVPLSHDPVPSFPLFLSVVLSFMGLFVSKPLYLTVSFHFITQMHAQLADDGVKLTLHAGGWTP